MCDNHMYAAIDLKSFYASVECVERGLDPFTTNLVVADPTRSKSTICLAVTPAMKQLGVRNRCRIHEIPEGISYITAMPRMQLYIDYSAHIYSIYLRYISPDDIHVYSIDECFLDLTAYLNLYHLTSIEFTKLLMSAVHDETGICATAGVGTNLYLAKIAMDIIAKHSADHIGLLTEVSYKEFLWDHKPLTDFWRIGRGTASTLSRYAIYTMGDIARTSLENEDLLYKLFGVDAELLIDHAWGIEPCTIADIKSYTPETTSISSGQVLMRNYTFDEARIIIREMTELLVLELVSKGLTAASIALSISYDHRFGHPGDHRSCALSIPSSSTSFILSQMMDLYDSTADHQTGIRRVTISLNRLSSDGYMQYDLFSSSAGTEREKRLQKILLDIRRRYGANAIMKGYNLLECSNFRERNNQIGGHHK